MSRHEESREDRTERLGSLRPDDVARARLRASILRRAAPLLAARREEGWWRTASGWSTALVPAAAAAALAFAWLAHSADVGTEPTGELPADALIGAAIDGSPPAVLTSRSAPSAEMVLEAAVYSPERRRR